jgi:hypothetical protein
MNARSQTAHVKIIRSSDPQRSENWTRPAAHCILMRLLRLAACSDLESGARSPTSGLSLHPADFERQPQLGHPLLFSQLARAGPWAPLVPLKVGPNLAAGDTRSCLKGALPDHGRQFHEARGLPGTQGGNLPLFRVEPRDNQKQMLEDLYAAREVHGRHRTLVVAATGTGKTVLAGPSTTSTFEAHPRRSTRALRGTPEGDPRSEPPGVRPDPRAQRHLGRAATTAC